MQKNQSYVAWSIWIAAAIFYAYEFFLRISPTVMKPELMQAFGANPIAFSSLSASYYYAYALMQIPVGLIIDKLQVRTVLCYACLIVSLGTGLFSNTNSLFIAHIGRILMGIGSAFAFTGCIKLAKIWFPLRRVALVVGLTNTLGVIGAIMADTIFAFLLEHSHWRHLLNLSAISGIAIALVILLTVRKNPLDSTTFSELSPKLYIILKDKAVWITALYGALLVAPISGFAELWSVPFLMTAQGFHKPEAATFNAIIFIGIAIGGTLNGWYSGWMSNRKPLLQLGSGIAALSLGLIVYFPTHSKGLLGTELFIFGYSTSAMLLIFAFNTHRHHTQHAGFVIAMTNMIVMLCASLAQPMVGAIIALLKSGGNYPALTEYQIAFGLLLGCQIIAFILTRFFHDPLLQEFSHA